PSRSMMLATASRNRSGRARGSSTGKVAAACFEAPARGRLRLEQTSTSCPARPSERTAARLERCSPSVTRMRAKDLPGPGEAARRSGRGNAGEIIVYAGERVNCAAGLLPHTPTATLTASFVDPRGLRELMLTLPIVA